MTAAPFVAALAAVLAFCTIGASVALAADNADLTVDVSGLRNFKGRLVLTLWAESESNSSFPDPSRVQFRDERSGDSPCDFAQAAVCRRTIESLQNLTVS